MRLLLFILAVVFVLVPALAQQVQGTPDDPGAIVVVIPSQSWLTWLLFYTMGLLALVLRIGKGVREQGGMTIEALVLWVKANSLSALLSWLSYTIVILLWLYTDILQAVIGWYQGVLTGGTILVGLSAEQFLSNISADQMRVMRDKMKARGTNPDAVEL